MDDEQPKKAKFWFWVFVIITALVSFSYFTVLVAVPWFED